MEFAVWCPKMQRRRPWAYAEGVGDPVGAEREAAPSAGEGEAEVLEGGGGGRGWRRGGRRGG